MAERPKPYVEPGNYTETTKVEDDMTLETEDLVVRAARTRSAFNIYKLAVYQQIKQANPTFRLGQIATKTTTMWQALSETERTQYSDEHNPSIIPQSIRAHLATSNPTTASSRCCAACTTLQTNDHPLSRCKCHSVYYCNSKCQKAHWVPHQEEHRRLVQEKKAKKNAGENEKKKTPPTTTSVGGETKSPNH